MNKGNKVAELEIGTKFRITNENDALLFSYIINSWLMKHDKFFNWVTGSEIWHLKKEGFDIQFYGRSKNINNNQQTLIISCELGNAEYFAQQIFKYNSIVSAGIAYEVFEDVKVPLYEADITTEPNPYLKREFQHAARSKKIDNLNDL